MKQKINKRFVPRQQYVEYYENGSLKSIGNYTKSDCKPIGLISFFHEADLSIGADYYDLAMVIISDGYVTLPGGFGYRKKQKKKGFEIFKFKIRSRIRSFKTQYYFGLWCWFNRLNYHKLDGFKCI